MCMYVYIYKTCIRIISAWPGPAPPSPERVWWLPFPELRESQAGEFVFFFISIRQVHDGLSAVKTCHGLSSWGVKLEMYTFLFELHPGSCRSNNVKPPVLQRQGFNVTTWRGGPSCSSVLRRWRGQGAV